MPPPLQELEDVVERVHKGARNREFEAMIDGARGALGFKGGASIPRVVNIVVASGDADNK